MLKMASESFIHALLLFFGLFVSEVIKGNIVWKALNMQVAFKVLPTFLHNYPIIAVFFHFSPAKSK